MKPSSRKNIHSVLTDVRHPSHRALPADASRKDDFLRPQTKAPLILKPSALRPLKRVVVVTIITLAVMATGFGLYLWNFKNEAASRASSVYDDLKSAAWSLSNLENNDARTSLDDAQTELTELQNKANVFSILPILKEIPAIILQVRDLTVKLKSINEGVDTLKMEGFKMLFGGEGEKFTSLLKSFKNDVAAVGDTVSDLRNRVSLFGALPLKASEDYLAMNVKVDRLTQGLEAVISLLEKPGSTHFIMLFENPSEMRPAGGFSGSYADLVLEGGSVKSIEVDDIYRPDKFLDLKIVPPLELQGVTSDWGARDANWFFNFPDSAEKTIELIQDSSIYEDQGIVFDGVAAINVRVMEDILKITGPVEISEYNLTLDDKNFLREVQYEVEAGRDKKPGQNPKKVLKFILPKILEDLKNLTQSQKKLLVDVLSYRLANKDIKFYFKDERLESVVSHAGFGGEVYLAPATWDGDYLAVVNTNVAGGKSDAFISQKIELASKIDSDGLVSDNLSVTRTHSGQNEEESWYRQTNRNFIKIFTPLGSKLTALSGNTPKTIKPLVNYEKKGYAVDEDLKALEDTKEDLKGFNALSYRESEKTVFATWFDVPGGKTKELSLTYQSQKKIGLAPGSRFQFVYDKQSGVESDFEYILTAPPGFKWQEINSPIYRYKSDILPSRLVINLTLEEI